jgi:acetoin utilization protein AcuB
MDTRAVSSVVSREPVYATPDMTVRAARSLAKKESDHLLVSENDNVVGILCSCDLEGARGDARVGRVMKSPVISVEGGTSLDDAAEIMRRKGVGSLPVLCGGLVMGIVTRADLIRGGVPRDRVGSTCASCGTEHHVKRPGAPFCADCLECGRDADLGEGD